MGSGSKEVTIGYRYYLGVHAILCHGPIDKITRIDFEEKTAWTGNASSGTISVSAESLFGGEDREGGVSGAIDVQMGSSSQGVSSYLSNFLGTYTPAFRGVFGLIFKTFYFGQSPYLKKPGFWCQRIHVRQNGIAQWYDSKAAIGNDMNAAHIIRECLTDPDWGMGYPEADMDDTAFMAAADTLYSEGIGLSILWDSTTSIEDFITEILKHIDGSVYVDKTSGKFILKLARPDYDINTILELNEADISKISDFKRSSTGELINSVTVVFWDSSTGKNGSVTVQDIALIAQQGSVISTTKQLPGLTTTANATKVAERILRALSVPLVSCTVFANRKAATLGIGSVVKISWPKFNITQIIMRVVNIEYGTLTSNAIKLQLVEDVFGQASSIFTPASSDWTNPVTAPQPVVNNCIQEATFYELCQIIGETTARSFDSLSGYSVITGVRPSGNSIYARLYSYISAAWTDKGNCDFCPSGLASASLSKTATSLVLTNTVDLDLVKVGTYAVLGNELVGILSVDINTNTIGLQRGVLDTVPQTHNAGDRIYFADVYFVSDKIQYAMTEVSSYRLLTVSGYGTLDLASSVVQNVTIQARHYKPYPPGNFQINGQRYPTSVPKAGGVAITWSHRDRLQQTAGLIDTTAGNIGPEAGTSYTVDIYDNDTSTLISSNSAISGTSFNYTPGTETNIRIELSSSRGGVESYQKHTHVLALT